MSFTQKDLLSGTASFRDPSGRLLKINGRILRTVEKSAVSDLNYFLSTQEAQKLIGSGKLVKTTHLSADENREIFNNKEINPGKDCEVFEHERIPFQSFPYEWSCQMLYAAALLTLEIAEEVLEKGFGLKDATPFNVLFRGCNPVFVDVLSFELRNPNDPIWYPYAQFVHTFLLPLLTGRYFGLSPDRIFITKREGLEIEDVYSMCNILQRIKPPFLTLISIPKWLASIKADKGDLIYKKKYVRDNDTAYYLLSRLFRGLRKTLQSLKPGVKKSSWLNYMKPGSSSYTQESFDLKQSFVEKSIKEFKPKTVLDVGCNTGFFSITAAKSGAGVIAVDSDPSVIDCLWLKAKEDNLDILPLVIDLTRPSPGIGWKNLEYPSFLERSRGSFDMVLMLAVIHHMLVNERIPLAEIIDLAAELTNNILVIEFVSPKDRMFKLITRGRDELFNYLTVELFEETCQNCFSIISRQQISNTERWLYVLQKKGKQC